MGTSLQSVKITLPASDIPQIKALVGKMGWKYEPVENPVPQKKNTGEVTQAIHSTKKDGIRPEVRQLMGIAANIDESLINSDPRLSYLLSR